MEHVIKQTKQENYPCHEFVLKAKTQSEAEKLAHKIIKKDYPEDYQYIKNQIDIREVTAESLIAYLTIN